jgi:hypothetical protein
LRESVIEAERIAARSDLSVSFRIVFNPFPARKFLAYQLYYLVFKKSKKLDEIGEASAFHIG